MRKIEDFLFVEQSFTDTEETRTAVININFIDNITCKNDALLGSIVIIETDNSKIIVKNPDNTFFKEFEDIIEDYC